MSSPNPFHPRSLEGRIENEILERLPNTRTKVLLKEAQLEIANLREKLAATRHNLRLANRTLENRSLQLKTGVYRRLLDQTPRHLIDQAGQIASKRAFPGALSTPPAVSTPPEPEKAAAGIWVGPEEIKKWFESLTPRQRFDYLTQRAIAAAHATLNPPPFSDNLHQTTP